MEKPDYVKIAVKIASKVIKVIKKEILDSDKKSKE